MFDIDRWIQAVSIGAIIAIVIYLAIIAIGAAHFYGVL